MFIRRLAGSATREPARWILRLDRKIAKFPQSVLHRQHGLCIVQVDNRFERYATRHCCVNVSQAKRRVVSPEMAATRRAELSVTHFRFFKVADEFLSFVTVTSSAFHKR